ncbi:hypothetical protein [Methylocystis sp.]|uniref:hypothetical protein n=1 Tax=Methylocystis sp. TaxID=1911079 RepID=UPI0025DC4755|nr:hypothetical protein [Methylocystis sp.]
MSPETARDALDRALAQTGQTVTLKRLTPETLAVEASVQLRAHVRDFSARELEGMPSLQNGASRVIIAARDLEGVEDWSGLPVKGDVLTIAGRERTVLYAWPGPYVGDTIVRIEMSVE